MDKLHSYRQAIKEAIARIRAAVTQARSEALDDIDLHQSSTLLTELESIEDRARRMLPELSAPPILSAPTQDPPTSPGYYRAFREGTGWVVVHVTEVSGVLWSEWLGTEKLLARDDRWAAWDHTRVELPTSPPTVTLS
jgi:hypothetical protein